MKRDYLRPTWTTLRFSIDTIDRAAIIIQPEMFALEPGDICKVDAELIRVVSFESIVASNAAIVRFRRAFAGSVVADHLAGATVELIAPLAFRYDVAVSVPHG